MGKDYRAKVFRSGNSVALRLPKDLGLQDGDEVVVVPHEDGSFSFWKESEKLAVLMGLYGGFSPGFMADGRGDTEQRDYDWDHHTASGEAA